MGMQDIFLQMYLKKIPSQMCSLKFYEIFHNKFFKKELLSMAFWYLQTNCYRQLQGKLIRNLNVPL